MKADLAVRWGGWVTTLLALAACAGIAALLGFGYHATREWQKSSELLVSLNTHEVAELLTTAIRRDMVGVQSRVLANRDWVESSVSLADTSVQVAIAFTRYPYPESFFSWTSGSREVVFFNRANRYPSWMPPPAQRVTRLPVVLTRDPQGAGGLRERINSHGRARVRYVAFDTTFGSEPYQVVARLTYVDPLQEEPDSVVGFTVNLAWVRSAYFGDLLSQVGPLVNRENRLEISVLDDRHQLVWGKNNLTPVLTKPYPLLFLDPSLGKVALSTMPAPAWYIGLSQPADSPLVASSRDAENTLLIAGIAALVLCLGLVLAIRAVHAGISLAAMRSDFVSSVTHDLKMPLTNIRMTADTLALRPVPGAKIPHYADILRHESRRLTRLIDNLLAYARITDVADVYRFEPLALQPLIDSVVRGFQQVLAEKRLCNVVVKVPPDLPCVRADRASLVLALDNLVDNAIRYSQDVCEICIIAAHRANSVVIEVQDRGVGIPADELSAVRRKFVRGRLALSRGTGLGLAIVSRIVGDHKGSFELESRQGVGTVARIILPAIEARS